MDRDDDLNDLGAPSCPECMLPMQPVVAAWWCDDCRVTMRPG